jgi:hypothetical protein
LRGIHEAQSRGLDFIGHLAHGGEKDVGIDLARDVDGFGEIEIGVGRGELCAEPHRHLPRGKGGGAAQLIDGTHALLQVLSEIGNDACAREMDASCIGRSRRNAGAPR